MLRTIGLLFLVVLLAGCGREPLHHSQAYVFGTLVDISIYGEEDVRAEKLANHVLREFQRLHDQLHAWQPDSDLGRVNEAIAKGESAEASPELVSLLENATAISRQSGGLFNPAIGQLIRLWGFQRDEFTPAKPDQDDIRRLVEARPAMTDLVIEGNRIGSKNPSVRLDLGGYAKGYALDLAAEYLRTEKVPGALVNIGGNIIAIGRHGNRPWRVGIQHPRQPGPIATLDLPDGWAIGTSGDYQRFFELDGVRYCHVIDPRNGQPVQGVQAVTILVPPAPDSGRRSDADSKPVFIARSDWRAAARQMKISHAMLIDDQGRIHLTPEMQQRLTYLDQHVALDIVP